METESDYDDPISTSEITSVADSQMAEDAAQAYAEAHYSTKKTKDDINYDHFQFSVAQKYDLTSRALTFKKIKYIADELFLDLKWRMRYTIQFQTSLFFIVFIFFLR